MCDIEEKECPLCKRFKPLSTFVHMNRQTPHATCETCREFVRAMRTTRL